MVQPAIERLFHFFVMLAIGIGGCVVLYFIYSYYKKRDERRLNLLRDEKEIDIDIRDREVHIGRRWMVYTLQIFAFSVNPGLLIIKWSIEWEAHTPDRGLWAMAMLLYLVLVEGGGFGIWLAIGLSRTMNYEAFESVMKYPNGDTKLHQWFYADPIPLMRGTVDVDGIVNNEIREALEHLDQDEDEATVFKVNGDTLYATLLKTLQFDSELVVQLTRHEFTKAWKHRTKRIYAASMPLNAKVSRTKFRWMGTMTMVTDNHRIKSLPVIYAPTDDQDDINAQREFDKGTKNLGAKEFIAVKVANVDPSSHKANEELGREKANFERKTDQANKREKARNEDNETMLQLSGERGVRKLPSRVKRDWAIIVTLMLLGVLIGVGLNMLFGFPMGNGG